MRKPPEYEWLMKTYNITTLMGGSDLALDRAAGGLVQNRRGGISWEDSKFDAMFQFVRTYQMNEPTLFLLFEQIKTSVIKESELIRALNMDAEQRAHEMLKGRQVKYNSMHALSDECGAAKVGRDACAGTIFVILNTLLRGLQKDLGVKENDFKNLQPHFGCESFGSVVVAASNNFRHYDEWTTTWVKDKNFTDQQLKSVETLAVLLDITPNDYRFLSGNVCPKILSLLSGEDYNLLNKNLFLFANNLAATA